MGTAGTKLECYIITKCWCQIFAFASELYTQDKCQTFPMEDKVGGSQILYLGALSFSKCSLENWWGCSAEACCKFGVFSLKDRPGTRFIQFQSHSRGFQKALFCRAQGPGLLRWRSDPVQAGGMD